MQPDTCSSWKSWIRAICEKIHALAGQERLLIDDQNPGWQDRGERDHVESSHGETPEGSEDPVLFVDLIISSDSTLAAAPPTHSNRLA